MSFSANLDELVAANTNGMLGAHRSWTRVPLSDVATILNGAPFDSGRFSKDRGVPLLRIRDVTTCATDARYDGEFDPAFWVEPGDLVVGMDGDFKCALWRGPRALLNQRVCKLTPDEGFCLRRFLVFALPGYLGAINDHTSSITVKHLSSRTVGAIPIPLPPLAEQRRIVEALETHFTRLDAAVATLERVRANLKRYRYSVLQAAVQGRLGGKPESWETTTLGSLLEVIEAGRSFKCDERPPAVHEVGVVKVSAVTWGEFDPAETKTCTRPDFVRPHLFIEPGDFLFSRANTIDLVGACVIARDVPGKYMLSDKILRLRFVPDTDRWVLLYLRSRAGRAEIERLATGNQDSMRNIGQERIRQIRVRVPPPRERVLILDRVDRVLSRCDHADRTLAAQQARASRLRQSLLQLAFAGRLVPQTSGDEPASVLLDRIRAERAAPTAQPPAPRRRTVRTR